jgi:hypothetical protein
MTIAVMYLFVTKIPSADHTTFWYLMLKKLPALHLIVAEVLAADCTYGTM